MNQRIQKQNIREKYWRYSLYVILLGLGTVIFVELIPFLGGLLGALTIYVLLRGQMRASRSAINCGVAWPLRC